MTGAFLGSLPSELLAGKLNNRVTVRVSNTSGAREAGEVSVGLYVSTTPDLQGDAVLVGTASRSLRMRPGQAANFPFHFASPSALPDGSEYLVAKIDGPDALGVAGSESIVVAPQPVAVVHPFIDLTGQATGPSSPITETGIRAARASMRVSVTNIGSSPASGPMQLAADMSLKTTFDGSAEGIGSVTFPAVTIKPGATRTFVVPLTIPAGTPGGTYTLFANINPARRIAESDYGNDIVTANGPLVIFSPTTTLGAGGGIGGYVSGGGSSGSNTSSNPPAGRIITGGGSRPIIRVTHPGNGTGSTPPYIGGGGGGTSGGDDSGGDDPGSGASCGGDDSGSSDPGSDNSGCDNSGGDTSGTDGNGNDSGTPTDGGGTGDPTNPGDDPNAGGDNGSDFGPDPGSDPGTDPGAGTDFGNPDDGTDSGGTDFGNSDSGGTDYGSDPGTDSGGDGGADFGGGDSSGSDFGGDVGSNDGSDPGGYADFAVATFNRTAAAKTSRATPSGPVAFRPVR